MIYKYRLKGWNEKYGMVYQFDLIFLDIEAESEAQAIHKTKQLVTRDKYMIIDVKSK